MQSSVALSVQVGSGLGDCTTQYWIQDPGSLILWHEAHLLIEKKKKIVKRRKKDICRFCSHFWTLYQDPGASQCGTGWATLPHGVLRNASSGDLVGEGNSLSLEKPASCLVVEVKSTTPKNSWTSPENQHHPLAQIFTVYKTLSCTFSSLTFTKHQWTVPNKTKGS